MLTAISLRKALANRAGSEREFEITEPYVPVIDGQPRYGAGAFGFLPDQQNAVDAFNRELDALKQEGELLRLLEPFGFSESELTSLTAEQLCTGDLPMPEDASL